MRFMDMTGVLLGMSSEWGTKLQLGHNREKLRQQVADMEVAVGRMEGIAAREAEKAAEAEAGGDADGASAGPASTTV